ncbi:MAG: hypothetical protein DRR19_21575 [Candidatus Parabeggiatoa sp. nov. 1]|nr:MAG: hypothetical protein DRR19_21575 [Gammaproteobacteria bacterium]
MRYINKLAFAVAFAGSCSVSATVATLEDLSETSMLVLMDSARTINTAADGIVLQLTPNPENPLGSAFGHLTVSTSRFSTFFKFRRTQPSNGEVKGLAFVIIQPATPNSDGGIIKVEFDTQNHTNAVGININGKSSASTRIPAFENSNTWHVLIDYEAGRLEVRMNETGERPSDRLLRRSVNLSEILGGNLRAYLGFTTGTGIAYGNDDISQVDTGTGSVYDNYDILRWSYRDELALKSIVKQCQVYGVHDEKLNDTQFFTVNPLTGKTKKLGSLHSDYDIESLAIHPHTEKLYAASSKDSDNPGMLYEVDKQTGKLTSIGHTGFAEVDSLAFAPDGTLWGRTPEGFITIDLDTGVGTLVIPYAETEIKAIAFSPDGQRVYAVQNTTLLNYDSATLTTSECALPGKVEALELVGDILYFSSHDKEQLTYQGLNVETCEVFDTGIKFTFDDVEGLAWTKRACLDERNIIKQVKATLETEPVPAGGEVVDDIAAWIHPTNPALSTVIGTQKHGGLVVYNLAGQQIQYLQDGRMTHVDLRYDFPLGGETVTLVAASNRATNSIALYKVNPLSRFLSNVATSTTTLPTELAGLCMYRHPLTNKYYVFVNDKSGNVEQWQVFDNGSGQMNTSMVRNFSVGSPTAGCVADDRLGQLYIGEKRVGIWKYNAEPAGGNARTQVDTTGVGGHIIADVAGLTLYNGEQESGYLIASSQRNNTFVIYQRSGNNDYFGRFQIVANNALKVDEVSDTKGIDVIEVPLGTAFPHGVFIAQDSWNSSPNENQNFKLVPVEDIAKVFGLQ